MSKLSQAFYLVFIALLQILHISINAFGQTVDTVVKINANSPTLIDVVGRRMDGSTVKNPRNFSFVRTAAGENLARRISEVMLFGADGKDLAIRKLIDGEYLAESDIRSWRYKIDLTAPNAKNAAHISSISNEQGILMLSDLLPLLAQEDNIAAVRFELPESWKILSTEKMIVQDTFLISNVEKAVFYVGRGWRERKIPSGKFDLRLAISGEWLFSDDEAVETAGDIFAEYRKLFGSDLDPSVNAKIAIAKFPAAANSGSWEAETRGRNVTVISSDMPFKTQSLQRLHEQLRHEIFHLWLPNGINLSGRYDWFYEGFALYQSLKTGVALNRIRFEDFLDTLSRAHNIDSMQTRPLSLIEASQNRWNGADTQVYARGMLVAFLCDLSLLQSSKGRSSVGYIFRKLYDSHRPPNPVSDANTSILKVLDIHPQLAMVVESYIKGSQKIDWQAQLNAAGIENEPGNSRTNLRVKAKLNGSQKALLDKLGYNNWRKLTRKS